MTTAWEGPLIGVSNDRFHCLFRALQQQVVQLEPESVAPAGHVQLVPDGTPPAAQI